MAVRRALLTTPPRRRAVRIVGAWLACLLALALGPGTAGALTIGSFATSRTAADGEPLTQAGAHPNLNASFALGESGESETAKDVLLGLPRGFFISPSAVPQCAAASFANFECAPSTQVGLVTLRADHEGDPSHLLGTAPVYALQPAAGQIAQLGFVAPQVNLAVAVPVRVRSSSDYGLDLTFQNLPQLAPLTAAKLTLWGVPADSMHDSQRFGAGAPGAPAGCPGVEDTGCLVGPIPVAIPALPLLHNPTACGGPIASTLDLDTYEHPGNFLSASFIDILGTSGCGNSGFSPMSSVALTTAQTRSPSGLSFGLNVNDEGFRNPDGIAQSQIKSISLALPQGLELDPAAVATLGTCSEAQFVTVPSTCPLDSEIGTFGLTVAGVDAPLEGSAYFGTPEPAGTNRLFLTASGPSFGIKLVGTLRPASAGAPVTLALPTLPQLPLETLALELDAGSELLRTPIKCGTYEAKTTFSPWSSSSAPATLTANDIPLTSTGPAAGPCPGPASAIALALSPASIRADGSSTSLATASVTDAGEIPVPGDEIAFASTDPGQRIGAVSDNGDGTYSARIVSSTAVGTQTITATDMTVGPGVFGTATLTQLGVESRPAPPSAQPPAPRPPIAAFTARPPRRTRDRTPTFGFASSKTGSSFGCRLDGQRFRPCASPKTLPRLGFGPHTFSVRATDPTGTSSAVVSYDFTVRRPPARPHRQNR